MGGAADEHYRVMAAAAAATAAVLIVALSLNSVRATEIVASILSMLS